MAQRFVATVIVIVDPESSHVTADDVWRYLQGVIDGDESATPDLGDEDPVIRVERVGEE